MLERLAQIKIEVGDGDDQINIPTGDPSSVTVNEILTMVFGILGGIALLIIIYAGLKFVLSRGNPEAAAKARNTIIYAAVGLVVALLAFTIVRFVTREVA